MKKTSYLGLYSLFTLIFLSLTFQPQGVTQLVAYLVVLILAAGLFKELIEHQTHQAIHTYSILFFVSSILYIIFATTLASQQYTITMLFVAASLIGVLMSLKYKESKKVMTYIITTGTKNNRVKKQHTKKTQVKAIKKQPTKKVTTNKKKTNLHKKASAKKTTKKTSTRTARNKKPSTKKAVAKKKSSNQKTKTTRKKPVTQSKKKTTANTKKKTTVKKTASRKKPTKKTNTTKSKKTNKKTTA